MRLRIVAFLLIASICAAQAPTIPRSANPAVTSDSITVPPGTLVALNLISAIKKQIHQARQPRARRCGVSSCHRTSRRHPGRNFR